MASNHAILESLEMCVIINAMNYFNINKFLIIRKPRETMATCQTTETVNHRATCHNQVVHDGVFSAQENTRITTYNNKFVLDFMIYINGIVCTIICNNIFFYIYIIDNFVRGLHDQRTPNSFIQSHLKKQSLRGTFTYNIPKCM